ncbi:MAG: hypothetical protein R3C53_24900 [Pirellulaceae bacterium]
MGDEKPQRIAVEALRLATEWQYLFSRTLREAAQEIGKDSERIEIEHFRKALPKAIDLLTQHEQTLIEDLHEQRRAA